MAWIRSATGNSATPRRSRPITREEASSRYARGEDYSYVLRWREAAAVSRYPGVSGHTACRTREAERARAYGPRGDLQFILVDVVVFIVRKWVATEEVKRSRSRRKQKKLPDVGPEPPGPGLSRPHRAQEVASQLDPLTGAAGMEGPDGAGRPQPT